MEEYILAIDIGGTSIKTGITLKDSSQIIETGVLKNIYKGNYDLFLEDIKKELTKYIEKYNVIAIGIGTAGEVKDGIIIEASNLFWKNCNIKEDISKMFNLPVSVKNDGEATALVEIKYGALKDINSGLLVTIGKGIGGAIVSNNKIIVGNGNAGNFGHFVRHSNGRQCNCGRKGCFETYTSITGLIKTVQEVNATWDKEEEKIQDIDKISGRKIAIMYERKESEIIKRAVHIWNNELSEGLLDLAFIFDPEIIVIAGGVTESHIISVKNIYNKFNTYHINTKIVISSFKGKAGLIGASLTTSEE